MSLTMRRSIGLKVEPIYKITYGLCDDYLMKL